MIPLDGPFYDHLSVGEELPRQPSVAIDEGMAALYQSITGERLAMALDPAVTRAVTGRPGRLASPGLSMQLSIGQSTAISRRAVANLFYRDVRFLRPVFIGESIATTATVAALADSRARPGRPHRGKVLVDIITTADGVPAIRYQRAPLLPQIGGDQPGHSGDLGSASRLDLTACSRLVPAHWDFAPLGPPNRWQVGTTVVDPARDVISSALALVRLTGNLALVHRDSAHSPYPQRLVYGGHVVGLAQASLSRVLAGMATVVGWHNCDHTGPAFEGDSVSFRHTLLDEAPAATGRVFAVQVEGFAHRDDCSGAGPVGQAAVDPISAGAAAEAARGGAAAAKILDWTVVAATP